MTKLPCEGLSQAEVAAITDEQPPLHGPNAPVRLVGTPSRTLVHGAVAVIDDEGKRESALSATGARTSLLGRSVSYLHDLCGMLSVGHGR